MKKILTISEPDCGGKPMGYAVEIPNDNRETLAAEISKGLQKGWYFNDVMAENAYIDEDLDALKEQGYTYIPGDGVDKSLCAADEGRFLVEVTIMDEAENGGDTEAKEDDEEPTRYSPFARLKVVCEVDWDFDEGDTPPDRHFEVTFTPAELEHFGVLDKGDIEQNDWDLYEGKLEEYMGEYLTDFTDLCHKGYRVTAIQPLAK